MTITISPDVESRAREKAAFAGLSVEAYVEQLILEDEWPHSDEDDPEFEEIRAAVMEGLDQFERGEGRPAEEVFAELRAKHGIPR